MPDVSRSLDEITTSFTIFEKNQVLTHEQLNDLGRYLNDQERLTRVAAVGVGVGCGLRPSIVERRVRVTRGVGITTDGDLFRFADEAIFNRFKPYDEAAPRYEPFFTGGARMPLFELIRAEDEDPRAISLANFAGRSGFPLESMVVLLLMESYEQDPDLCTGADCDNLGKNAINTPRVMLVDQRRAQQLRPTFDTRDAAARELGPITAARPIMTPAADTPAQIAAAYRAACGATLAPLQAALTRLYPRCAAYLAGLFPEDPGPGWTAVLQGLQAKFAADSRGIQYFYDFLVDLVETYTAFRSLLFGDTAICAPDVAGFPKHLLLGALARDVDASQFRTPFYPSPLVAGGPRQNDRRRHARFLARKLDTLIFTFDVPQLPVPVRVTPSQLEDRALEDRAIPHYYKVTDARPIHRAWNYRLEEAGMSAFNYSHSAALYGAQGAAADPLRAPIALFGLFRIEGHLGRNVQDALAQINRDIQAFNLPIAVRAVMLDPDRTKLPWRPPFRITDLHRLHYLVRNEVANQLGDATTFSDRFKAEVDKAVQNKVVVDADGTSDSVAIQDVANDKSAAVKTRAALAISKLTRPYESYRADASWQTDVGDTLESAAQFKYNLGRIVKTEFSTPYDNLIANPHLHWLPWLEDLIDRKNEKEETRVLFGAFLTEHRGLEHRAGVPAGGTFVLAHDTEGTVVADFALPYFAPAPVEEREDEPPLVRPPGLRPPFIVDSPIRILPSREKLITDKLEQFRVKLQPELNTLVETQSKYLEGLKDSLSIITGVPTGPGKPGLTQPGAKVVDPVLDSHVKETRSRMDTVEFIRGQLLDPSVDPARREALEGQLKTAEGELADSVTATTKYVAESAVDVSAGSDGNTALATVSEALSRVSNRDAINAVKSSLDTARTAANTKPETRLAIETVMRTRGIGR